MRLMPNRRIKNHQTIKTDENIEVMQVHFECGFGEAS